MIGYLAKLAFMWAFVVSGVRAIIYIQLRVKNQSGVMLMKKLRFIVVFSAMLSMGMATRSVAAPGIMADVFSIAGYVQCTGGMFAFGQCPPGFEPVNPIIFSEDFDAQADWSPINGSQECNGKIVCPSGLPTNWTYMRNIENWHPLTGFPTKKPGQAINSDQARGGTGKSWLRYHESSKETTETNTFGDDTLLLKTLPGEYDEIYASFYIKFDPTWQWTAPGTGIMKLFRAYHFDGPDGVAEPWQYFTNGDSAPIYIYDLKLSNVWGYRGVYSLRCDPQESVYFCPGGNEGDGLFSGTTTTTPFADIMGDSQWHRLKFHLKMNSALGAADGVMEVWMDGLMQFSITNIIWRDVGSDLANGWNMIGLGGNTTNWYSDPVNEAEQWYAIDDLIVSTEDIE